MFYSWSFIVLIYINDFSKVFSTNAKLFADNTSLFFVVNNIQILQIILIKAWKEWISGLIDRKWNLIQILLNKLKKLFLVTRQKKDLILHYCLIVPVLISSDIFPITLGSYTWHSVKVWRPSKNGFWKSKQNFRTSS